MVKYNICCERKTNESLVGTNWPLQTAGQHSADTTAKSAREATSVATLIKGEWVVAFDGRSHVLIPDGVVVVDGNRVVHVGHAYDGTPEHAIGGAGMLVAPGFIDVHVHAGSRALHRLFSDSGRPELFGQPFLEVAIARPGTAHSGGPNVDRETGMTAAERTQLEADFTVVELLQAGITTFLEFGAKLPMQEALARSVTQLGARGYLAAGFESGTWSCDDAGRPLFNWDEAAGRAEFDAGLAFAGRVTGGADDRIRTALVPRFSETCSKDLLASCLSAAREMGMPVAMHAAYNVHEFYQIVTREGATPIAYLAAQGLLDLGPTLNLGHCNFVGESAPLNYSGGNDIALIGHHGCTVSHCPVNLVRRARTLDNWKRYRAAGVNMALGTDTYPRDMMMQMRTASYFGKVLAHDLNSATAAEMFDAATIGPARSLGRDDIGRLSVGAKADVNIINLKGGSDLRIGPVRDPIRSLVECGIADDVRTVMVDGLIRMQDRHIPGVDISALRAKAQRMADGVWASLQDWDPLRRTADEMNPPSYPILRS
jgi:cytosine/adenosine deaminase-related metal-dependent hydrolase